MSDYLSEIGEYIKDIQTRNYVWQENDRITRLLERRPREFYEEIFATIENNKDKEEIIPIYEQIEKAKRRLPECHILDTLKSIEGRYADRFITTNTCFAIAKSKAEGLKSLLEGEPGANQAYESLIKNGIPERCITLTQTL